MPDVSISRRDLLLGGTAMIGFSLSIGAAARSQSGPIITAPELFVDDTAPAGTLLAAFSVANDHGGGSWSFALTGDADGMFALDGSQLVVGATPLDHYEAPDPAIRVTATKGPRTIERIFPVNVRRALPSLPFPTGAKVMGIGHSFVSNSGYTVVYPGTPTPRIDTMTANWLGAIGPLRNVDNRFNLDCWYDPDVPTGMLSTARFAGAMAGLGGEHMPQTLNRLPWCLGRRPDIVVLDIGTNDINSGGITLQQGIDHYEALLKPIRNAGIWVVCLMPIDRIGTGEGLWPEGDPRHAVSNGLADYIASLAEREGIRVVDDRSVLANALAQGTQITEDGVHLNTTGQWMRYSMLLPLLRGMVSAGDFYSRNFASANLSPLGGMLGSGGTKTNVTGNVANGMTAIRGAGQNDTITASKEVITAGVGEKQIFSITPASNANASRVATLTLTWPNMSFADLGLAAGDWVEAGFDYELSQSKDWLGLEFVLEAYSADNVARQSATGGMVVRLNATQDGPHLTAPLAGRATIPRFRLLDTDDIAAPTSFFRTSLRPIRLSWKKDSTDTLVARISPVIIRKSTDPQTVWNL